MRSESLVMQTNYTNATAQPCPMTLARVNLPALVAQWARFVDDLERQPGAYAALPDFLADVAVRHEIAQRLRARSTTAETRDLLADVDAAFRRVTQAADRCVHGDDVAAVNGWSSTREWYYWRIPASGDAPPAA
jgi:hypothetical protein